MRFGGLCQAVELDFGRAHGAGSDQLRYTFKRRAGAADRGPQRGHVVAIGLRRLRARGDEGGTAAGLSCTTEVAFSRSITVARTWDFRSSGAVSRTAF